MFEKILHIRFKTSYFLSVERLGAEGLDDREFIV